jgi:DNA-binding MarR family transcriptional regulator
MSRRQTPGTPARARAPAPTVTGEAAARAAAATPSWLSVVGAYQRCDAAMSARLAALGLRVPEHEVLVNLLSHPGLTQQALAQRCYVAKSGISMLLTRLQDRGLVQRDADATDGRVWRLRLTAEGEALARRSRAVQQAVVQAMAAPVSAAELAAVQSVMERVSAALDALPGPD